MSAGGADRGPRIAVLDYGMGNRRSVQKALERVGARASITCDHDELRASAGLVVPGVGAFPLAMGNLHRRGLGKLIQERAAEGTPILGICLGMQLLFDGSEEIEPTAGLGLIAGEVRWLNAGGLRVPHIGWNDVHFERSSPLTAGLPGSGGRGGGRSVSGCPFYHVHSLAARPSADLDTIGITEYGERFATIVQRGNVFGVQFHPEKSSLHGLAMLANFTHVVSSASGEHGAATSERAAAARA